MDGARFDRLTRSLARGTSRRGLLKGLAAGVLGGVTGLRATATDAQRPPRQPNGALCSRATDCASFHCANGVCCETACTGQCASCATGVCHPVTGAPEPGRAPCPSDGPCAATCDGVTTSHCAAYPDAATTCGPATCANGWQITYACAGNGACAPTTTACAPFGCDAAGLACATGCEADADCGPGSHCDASQCLPDEGIGAPCDEDTDCQSGFCVNDVCCAERCGDCQVCNLPGNEGFCGPDPTPTTCGDGGLCCEGGCIDPLTDVEHCGGCDQPCLGVPNGYATCVNSNCDFGCLAGYRKCPNQRLCIPDVPGSCCTVAECPAATAGTCEGEPTCLDHTCGIDPLPVDTVCREAPTACFEDAVCDGANTICPANPAQCPEDQCCAEECVDTQIDIEHCGRCDNTCVGITSGQPVCNGGVCDIACLPGFLRCDVPETVCVPDGGCCTDLDCAAAAWCDIPAHTCRPDQPYGDPCQRDCLGFGEPACSQDNMCLSDICLEVSETCGCANSAQCPEQHSCNETDNTCDCTPLTCDEACGTECFGTAEDGCGGTYNCACSSSCHPACFWLNNDTDSWQRVPASTQAGCQELDSCAPGGGGDSDGGCYKWATSSNGPVIAPPW